MILLTGDSGRGKSTLFKVVLGEVTPKMGTVSYKDKEGKVFIPNPEEIGYLAQDNTLFPDTIKNNITMFDSKLDKEVNNTIKKVNLSTDIEKFPKGLKTLINLDSENLSGGQK